MCWRTNLNSMSQRLEAVMNNNIPDISHDIVFIVGPERLKISCHKIFLSIASPVFEAMFSQRHVAQATESTSGPDIVDNLAIESQLHISPSKEKDESEICVPDLDLAGFKNIIKYAYRGRFNVDVKDALATMFAADKYDIPELTSHCSQVLQRQLNIENVVTIYQSAVLLNDNQLKEKALEYIELHSGMLMHSEQFLEFSEANLCDFLKLDYISDGKSEVDVFNAILRWGNHQCYLQGLKPTIENCKALLKVVIPLIRFPVMESHEFSDVVEPSGILSREECYNMFKYFSFTSLERRLVLLSTMIYSWQKRKGLFVPIFCSVSPSDKSYREVLLSRCGGPHYDTFSVSGSTETLKLKAVGVVLPSQTKTLTEVKVAIQLFSSCKVKRTAKKVLSRPLEISYIEFEQPVSIQPDLLYAVQVLQSCSNGVQTVAAFPGELLKIPTSTLCNISDKKRFTVTYCPSQSIIWSLQFEY